LCRHLLDGRLDSERPAEAATEAADRCRLSGGNGRRNRDRPALLPVVPAPARLGLRATVRCPARRLAAGRRALHRTRLLLRPGRPSAAARRLGLRLRALPVALAARALLVDRRRLASPSGARDLDGIAAELRGGLRARHDRRSAPTARRCPT